MGVSKKIQGKLSDDEFIFDPAAHELFYVKEMIEKGMHPVCYRCGARLLHALSPAEAKINKTPPGIRCPVSLRHCEVVVSFGGVPRLPDISSKVMIEPKVPDEGN